MQLVANGAQDVYLTENPTITYWKRAYQRHTNFSVEASEQVFNGPLDFSKRVTCTITRNGDLIYNTYLEVTLPKVPSTLTPNEVWVDYIGHALIKSIDISIGGQTIDKHFGDWLHIWYQLSNKNKEGYEKMIGARVEQDEQTLYIPLQFWWNRSPGMALPLIALQYHEVKITIEFNDRATCIKTGAINACNNLSISKASLFVDFVYIDTEERRRFAQASHEYLIQQLQFAGEETVSSGERKRINLSFNHPCKEIVWAIQTEGNIKAGKTFDYSIEKTVSVETVEKEKSTKKNASIDHIDDGDEILGNLMDETEDIKELSKNKTYKIGTVANAKIQLNGHDRITERPGSYYNLVQPYQHHSHVPNEGIYCYSFALEPESDQPSGTCNMSRIDTATLSLQLNEFGNSDKGKIKVFATNFNVLRVMGGMGGLAFAN